MMLTAALFAADLEILQEVREVLKGPNDVNGQRASLIARALAALEPTEVTRPRTR